jgi:predicted metalloenzyme YecM
MNQCGDISSVLGGYVEFVDAVVEQLDAAGLNSRPFEMDHICYRCETQVEYEEVCRILQSGFGESLGVTMVGGRPINTIKLHQPLEHPLGFKISCIEIPSPKPSSYYPKGLEHVEFVIGSKGDAITGSESKILLEKFIEKCSTSGFLLPFDTRAINKDINPDVSVELSGVSGPQTKISVKFHVRPLMEVIEYEQNVLHMPFH